MAKKITAPKTYDPGKGRPKEHLAYLNEREMAYLRSINGNNMERGPKGLPSFPPKDAVGSSSKASPSRGPGGPSGPNSSPSGSRGIGGGGKGSTTGGRGPGGPSGPNSAASGSRGVGGGSKGPGGPSGPNSASSASRGPSQTKTPSAGGYKGPASPMSGQGTSFKSPSTYSDRSIQQKVQTANTQKAVKSVPAVRSDLSSGGIRTLNVGPMGTPVKVSRPSAAGMSFTGPQSVSKPQRTISAAEAYRPSAISPGGLATPGSIPISRAMNFAESMPGMRDPKMAESIKAAALRGEGLFSFKGATPEQQALVDRIGPTVLSVSMDTGLDPRTVLGQALTESTTAKHSSKVSKLARDANNLFAVKGTGTPNQFWKGDIVKMPTNEVIAGKTVVMNEPFRKYDSPEQALMDYGRLMGTSRYKKAAEYSTPEEQLRSIRGSGYATHPAKSYVDMGVKNAARISFGGGEPSLAAASRGPAGSGIISSAYAADAPTGPLMSGNAGPQGSFVSGAVSAITDALKNPKEYQVSIPEAPAFVKAMPDKLKQAAIYAEAKKFGEDLPGRVSSGIEAIQSYTRPTVQTATAPKVSPSAEDAYGPKYVSPEVQEEMAEIDKMNRRGTRVMKAATGPIGRAADAVRGLITGKNTAEADADLKRAYMQANAAQRAELERRNPNLTKFAQQAGLEPQLPMSNYENWRQRSFGTGGAGGVSTTVVGSGGTPDFGSGGKFQYRPGPGGTPYSPPPTTTEKAERGRPQQYYNWDAGVGIPSPGDSDYTLYLKYLEEKAAARAAVS